jgi:hypothetical protein
MGLLSLFVMQSPQSAHAAPHVTCTKEEGNTTTPHAVGNSHISIAPESQFYDGKFLAFTLTSDAEAPILGAVSVAQGNGCPRFTQVGWLDSRGFPNGKIFAWHLLVTDKNSNSVQLLTFAGNVNHITFDGVNAQALIATHQYQFQVNASYYPNDNQSLPFVTTNFSADVTVHSR